MRCAYPPYAGTFFICWGDEILNMIVKLEAKASGKEVPKQKLGNQRTPVGDALPGDIERVDEHEVFPKDFGIPGPARHVAAVVAGQLAVGGEDAGVVLPCFLPNTWKARSRFPRPRIRDATQLPYPSSFNSAAASTSNASSF